MMEGQCRKKTEARNCRRAARIGSQLELGAFKMLLKEDDKVIDIPENVDEEEDDNPVYNKLEDHLTNEALKVN